MVLRKLISGVVLGLFVIGGGAAIAQKKPAAKAGDAKFKKETRYDFDDDLVEGELQRPDGEYIDVRRKAKHSSLIKIRENFIPEMLKSAEDI